MTVTIYHNPSCLTSRNVLAMIRQSGEEPIVIECLKNPPSRERLKELIKAMDIPLRALLREQELPMPSFASPIRWRLLYWASKRKRHLRN
jgi:arsenate reductase